MGVALAIKPAARSRFSVLAFGLTQVAIDLEPLVGMLRDTATLHGWTHTVGGALLIATAVSLVSARPLASLVAFLHRKASENRISWLLDREAPTRGAVWLGAMVGALSHLALDGLIHHDMHPLAPLSQTNPFIGRLDHDLVYLVCVVTGVVGAVAWMYGRWDESRDRHDAA